MTWTAAVLRAVALMSIVLTGAFGVVWLVAHGWGRPVLYTSGVLFLVAITFVVAAGFKEAADRIAWLRQHGKGT